MKGITDWRIWSQVKAFRAPTTSIGNLDAQAAASLIAAAGDVALIIDADGIVRDVAFNSEGLATELRGAETWSGKKWADIVTVESRPKVEALLREASSQAEPRLRHINHPVPTGDDIPILYSAVPVGDKGRVVAFGRDLRDISRLQQRLVDAQQSMERDYARIRTIETRYRLLFQTSADAVFILDADIGKVAEANPAAQGLLGQKKQDGREPALFGIFAPESVAAVQSLLAMVRATGRPDDVRARLADGNRDVRVTASLFREDQELFFLIRILMQSADATMAAFPKLKTKLLKLVENAPDGFVVSGMDGRVITANAAFLDMIQMTSEQQVQGESLDRWVGRPGVDLDVLMANLRQRGSVRLFATILRGDYNTPTDIEISAVSVMNGGEPCFGFAIRNVGPRLSVEPKAERVLPRSVEQLTELIGRVALKDLVREATDVIERLCIETALELTDDNRASAAEMLGLSRQSLYVKLRRYGLGDLAAEGPNA